MVSDMSTSKNDQNYINHVAVVMDGSGSMSHLQGKVVEVVDKLVAHLAVTSKEMNQETRITVYVFDDYAECVYFDVDALRLPSVKDRYWVRGMTALVDATMLSIEDLELTATKYGDHSFLIYVVTDGRENKSQLANKAALPGRIKALADNWTLGILVPDVTGVHLAKQYGFPAGNIATWDTTSEAGLEEAARVVTASVNQYMDNRSQGVTGSKSLFSTDSSVLNAQTVKAAKLTPVDPSTFVLVPVYHEMAISEFVTKAGYRFQAGTCYYQLNKSEEIHAHKDLMVRNKLTGEVFGGERVRDLIGLPRVTRRVSPKFNEDWEVFPQSSSLNRKLVPGTNLLIKTT
jgi:hypothetical protein